MRGPDRGYARVGLQDSRPRLERAHVARRSNEATVLVEPIMVGICRSDIRELLGTRSGRADFGHEILGRVTTARDAAFHPGDLVVLDPHVTVGYRSTAFGSLMEVHGSAEAVQAALVRFSPGAWTEVGCFVEPLACAVHCWNVLGASRNGRVTRVLIIGAGTAGTLLAAVFALHGVKGVLVNKSP